MKVSLAVVLILASWSVIAADAPSVWARDAVREVSRPGETWPAPPARADFRGNGNGCKREGKHCRWDTQCCGGLVCDAAESCKPGCRIDEVLYVSGAVNPGNDCEICDPSRGTTWWSNTADGASCDDGSACTTADLCEAGTCTGGSPPDCDDRDICTTDSCDPDVGCVSEVKAEGETCDMWVTDNTVNSTVLSGDTLYVGGEFRWIGPATGGGVPTSRATAIAAPSLPRVQGSVKAVAADGSGGWYIGGLFSRVGSAARSNLAHVLADNSVSTWDPAADYVVETLVVHGPTIYVGGRFENIGGQPRHYIAAVDAVTGLATDWDPHADNTVKVLAVNEGTVYAGGWFTNIGGQARSRIAALSGDTGLATDWDPDASWNGFFTPYVWSLAVSGSTVYAGGAFNRIGGADRNYLAALDSTTGLATDWNPQPNTGSITALLASGGTLYAGGAFTNIGGQPRSHLAAFDLGTGLLTPWNPDASSIVYALASAGDTVYVGGPFSRVGALVRNRAAAVDSGTGEVTSWNPGVGGASVLSLAVGAGQVYLGGGFIGVGGVERNGIAALDMATGRATPWNPNSGAARSVFVYSLALDRGTLYAGGEFDQIAGQARRSMAAFDTTTGALTDWDPRAEGQVYTLAVGQGTVYAGGYFTQLGGLSRNNIGAVDALGGWAIDWNPQADEYVATLNLEQGTVYAGGYFTNIGGQPRQYLAALDAYSGLATDWDPAPDGGDVASIAVDGSSVYVGGSFSRIGGQPRNSLAAVDPTTGLATAWDPDARNITNQSCCSAYVTELTIHDGTVYSGGQMSDVGGNKRNNLAALDADTGSTRLWDPNVQGSLASVFVYTLNVGDGLVVAGGRFWSVGGEQRNNLAVIVSGHRSR